MHATPLISKIEKQLVILIRVFILID